jgi:hypothetical protein
MNFGVFFALSVTISFKISGAVIPRRVFTQPGSVPAAELCDRRRQVLLGKRTPPPEPRPRFRDLDGAEQALSVAMGPAVASPVANVTMRWLAFGRLCAHV